MAGPTLRAIGFTGFFLLARSERPATELTVVRAVGATTDALWRAGNSDWQLLQGCSTEDPDLAATAATGAPALIASVFDSDVGWVRAGSPEGRAWECFLSPVMAREYGIPEEEFGDPDEIAGRAAAWAREAGMRPDPEAVRAVLVAKGDPFAEDLVFDLVQALGFVFEPDGQPSS
ncbi:hypothetical protein [Kitasatospora phosalacinea]|uniref:hypothetical protein n=1 Tax=Kitasatospora phosalacinea TaxID=2065 RepID=UPI00131D74E2|nr:hypothetical protein [Kitasatospora phosalacinea]